jgi:hypothetical protein
MLGSDHHVLASIHLVYVRILGKGIHLVYVRIPGKGITLHRLLRDDDDDTSARGIVNVLNKDNHV